MLDENTEEEIRILQFQAIALLALVFAFALGIYVIIETIKMKKSGIYDLEKVAKLDSYTELAALIFLIVSVYFLYRGFVTYKKDQTNANKFFLIAASLVAIAAAIRYFTLKSAGEEDFSNEDI